MGANMNRTIKAKYARFSDSCPCRLFLYETPPEKGEGLLEDAIIDLTEVKWDDKTAQVVVVTCNKFSYIRFDRCDEGEGPRRRQYGRWHDTIITEEEANRLRQDYVLQDGDIYEFTPNLYRGLVKGKAVLMIKTGSYRSKASKPTRMEWRDRRIDYIEGFSQ